MFKPGVHGAIDPDPDQGPIETTYRLVFNMNRHGRVKPSQASGIELVISSRVIKSLHQLKYDPKIHRKKTGLGVLKKRGLGVQRFFTSTPWD